MRRASEKIYGRRGQNLSEKILALLENSGIIGTFGEKEKRFKRNIQAEIWLKKDISVKKSFSHSLRK